MCFITCVMSHSYLSFRLGSDLSTGAAKVPSCSCSPTLQYLCHATCVKIHIHLTYELNLGSNPVY